MVWRYQSWSDDNTYFVNQVWYHLALWVFKICISTWDILLDPEFIHTWSDTSRPLRHRQRNDRLPLRCCLPWRHHGVTWITCSPLWRALIHRILKSLLPQNNTFFIATASVVKDAADNPDCQGLREQWYYLQFYVRRTMPPTVVENNSQLDITMLMNRIYPRIIRTCNLLPIVWFCIWT